MIATKTALPHWEEPPADRLAAIRQIKAALRARIAASGRTVEEVFAVAEQRIKAEVDDITAARGRGETVWPVIDYADIAAGTVPAGAAAKLRRRGCLVVRGHFDREQALGWDRGIVRYVEDNKFLENYRGPGHDFFGTVGSKPEIYPIYWSRAQMQARQSDRMARVQAFLNGQWKSESEGVRWFDPWDAAYRTAGGQYPGSTMCSAFRTFQGWTALSDMPHDQGVLHTVPIPGAMAYLMLRPLLADVPDDDMCGVAVNQVFPASRRWHPLLIEALSGIPDVRAGDSVWWHCDMIHSVAPVDKISRAGATSCTSQRRRGARATSGTARRSGTPSAPVRARATSLRSITNGPGMAASAKPNSTPPGAAGSVCDNGRGTGRFEACRGAFRQSW
jgi:hypothetical protein